MKLIPRDAPHIRHSDNTKTMMGDVIISLLPLYFMAFSFYRWRVVVLMLVSVAVCVFSEVFCVLIAGRKVNFRDFSAVVTGLIIPLVMPASAGYDMVAAAGVFAIVVAKQPFGGTGENLFNPAAAGLAFAIACWPTRMFTYPLIFEDLPLLGQITAKTANSAAYALKIGGIPTADFKDMFLGIRGGPMGATNILIILACLLYLSYRKTVRFVQPVSFIAAAAVMAYLFPRVDVTRVDSVLFELMSGSLLFGAVFMFSDPVTSPKRPGSQAAYGAIGGVVAMLFRYFGGYEQTVVFAILLMNALVPLFDWPVEIRLMERRQKVETAKPAQD